MCKCCIVKCFPEQRTLLKCCCFNLTYYKIFVLQTIFTVGFHFFDIGSDIAVLVDLKSRNSEYFTLCLIILFLPVIATTVRSLTSLAQPIRVADSTARRVSIFLKFFGLIIAYGICQLHFVEEVKDNLRIGRKTSIFVDIRMIESLLESAPESLFQLFIILKNASIYTYNEIITYYISITLSIFSLITSLISYEIFSFNNENREIIRNIAKSLDYTIPFDIREKPIKSNSRYVLLLSFYRITEVISRIGLLACIGNIYNGYVLLWFILSDFLLLFLIPIIRLVLLSELWFNLVKYCCFESPVIILAFFSEVFMKRLENLPVFSNYFLSNILYDNGYKNEEEEKKFHTMTMSHFISRYLNNTILSILIIYNLSVNTYSYSIFVISISSISSFVLNILFLYLILKYTYNYKKYQYIFKPIGCCKCDCCCKNIEDDIDEKHPDDIVI